MKKMTIFRLCSLSLLFNLISIEAKQERLTIVNDTKEKVRVSYPRKDQTEMKKILFPKDSFSYASGIAYIYAPKKHGNYEVTISLPRPAGSINKITLSQIIEAAKQKENVGEFGYFTEKGQIGDIKIFFEKIIED
ncbi:MAG: hypothetical protein WCD44_03820 [Candidatus Babeliales bacterium]